MIYYILKVIRIVGLFIGIIKFFTSITIAHILVFLIEY
jgi:hypothetical protein